MVTSATGYDVAHAQEIAKAADVVIVVLAQSSTEGHDRQWLNLTQSELVPAMESANKKTVVLTITPGPFLTAPWIEHAAAVVDIGLPGEQEVRAQASSATSWFPGICLREHTVALFTTGQRCYRRAVRADQPVWQASSHYAEQVQRGGDDSGPVSRHSS